MKSAKLISFIIIAMVIIHIGIVSISWRVLTSAQSAIETDAHIINGLGKIRGGIQRESKLFLLKKNSQLNTIEQLLNIKIDKLSSLVDTYFPELLKDKQKLITEWNQFKQQLTSCKNTITPACQQMIYQHSELLWNHSETLIDAVEKDAEKKITAFNTLLYIMIAEFVLLLALIITIYRLVNKTLGNSQEQMQTYIEVIDNNVITSKTDMTGNITYVSKAFCEISGYTEDELIGKNHRLIRHSDMKKELFEDLWKTISSGKTWSGEIKNRRKDGSFYWVYSTISPLIESKKQIGYVAIRRDITDAKELERIAVTDHLTGIYNRVKLDSELKYEANRASRYNSPLSVIITDIDHFKQVNDTYGHLVGDSVLVSFTDIIKTHIRQTDILGRWGGEEFLIISPSSNLEGSKALAEKLCSEISRFNFATVGKKTASFGVAQFKDNETIDSLLSRADSALYKAKESGRNCVKSG